MKTYLTRFVFFLLATGITFAQTDNQTAPPSANAPKVSIEKMEHNFGMIKEGTPVSAAFAIKNTGTSDLKIEEVAPSCGCTTSEYDQVIQPGKTGKVVLTLKPVGLGNFTKFAVVTTNDPQQPDIKLAIKYESFVAKGYRVGTFLFDPKDEISTDLAPGKNYSARIGFFYDGKEALKITDFKADKKAFDIRLETVVEGQRYNVIAQSAAPLSAGTHKQTVKLLTNLSEQPEIELSFVVNVVGGAATAPTAAEKTAKTKTVSRKIN